MPAKRNPPLTYDHQAINDYLGTHTGPFNTQAFNNLYTVALPQQATPEDATEQLRRHTCLLGILEGNRYKHFGLERVPVSRKQFLSAATNEFLAMFSHAEAAPSSWRTGAPQEDDSNADGPATDTVAMPEGICSDHLMPDASSAPTGYHRSSPQSLAPQDGNVSSAIVDSELHKLQSLAAQEDFERLSNYHKLLTERAGVARNREAALDQREEHLNNDSRTLKAKESNLRQREDRLQKQELQHQTMEHKLKQREDENGRILQAKENALKQREEQVQQEAVQQQKMEQALKQREECLDAKESNLQAKADGLAAGVKDGHLTLQKDKDKDKDKRILELQAKVDELNKEIERNVCIMYSQGATIAAKDAKLNFVQGLLYALPESFVPPHVSTRRAFLMGQLARKHHRVAFRQEVCALASAAQTHLEGLVGNVEANLARGLLVAAANELRSLARTVWDILEKVEPMDQGTESSKSKAKRTLVAFLTGPLAEAHHISANQKVAMHLTSDTQARLERRAGDVKVKLADGLLVPGAIALRELVGVVWEVLREDQGQMVGLEGGGDMIVKSEDEKREKLENVYA